MFRLVWEAEGFGKGNGLRFGLECVRGAGATCMGDLLGVGSKSCEEVGCAHAEKEVGLIGLSGLWLR